MSPSGKALKEAHNALFNAGIDIRRDVAGPDYVARALSKHESPFSGPLQDLLTEVGWGWIWARPGLDRKQRSLLNLGMLSALNRNTELAVHIRGGLRNGLSETEIREALLQVGAYCGLPAAMEGFRVAEKVIEEWKKDREPGERVKAKL